MTYSDHFILMPGRLWVNRMDNYRIYDKEREVYVSHVWGSLHELMEDFMFVDKIPEGVYVVESSELEKSMPLELLKKRGKGCNIGEQ